MIESSLDAGKLTAQLEKQTEVSLRIVSGIRQ